jgi:nucleoside-diphosphate-sugar epimerase
MDRGENLMADLHVVFGTGPLGRWTADALVKKGETVRMINRSGKMENPLTGVEIVANDAYDVDRNIAITSGAAAIYQCAMPRYAEWTEKFPPLQRAILEAAITNGAKLIVGDNLYMYGQFTGSLREDSPVRPNSKKGRVRAAMAQEVMDAHQAGKVQAAIGRAPDFFGPYDTALTGYAIQPAVSGKTINLLGSTSQPHTFTYIKDFGSLLATLGTAEEALGQIWFAPSNPPITQAEWVKLIEAELGRPVKSLVGSPLMMRLLGLFNKEIAETVEMMYEWTGPFVVDTSKAENAFGLQPTPLMQAMKETLDWCRVQAKK